MLDEMECDELHGRTEEFVVALEGDPLAPVRDRLLFQALHHLHQDLRRIERKVDQLMADFSALDAAVDKLVANQHAAAGAYQALADEVKTLQAGIALDQGKVDSVTAKLTDVGNALGAEVATPPPVATPPVESPPVPPPTDVPPAVPPTGAPPATP